ncbi:hypothetical protein [Streptomyces sp. NBC_00289]|uniref:hypothetical protein n=1 Tax=Streptomyces sp. NBC_00289 TaxID=2975703 RepID=UPI00352F78FA
MPAEPGKFAYRVPHVSGGLATRKIDQRTDWGHDYNRDRFRCNVRTHTLHDLVAYGRREVGRWVLEGELPAPTRYF